MIHPDSLIDKAVAALVARPNPGMTSDEFRDLVRNVAGTSAKRIASELRLHGYITRSVIVTAKARLREAQSRRRARLKERSDAHSAH